MRRWSILPALVVILCASSAAAQPRRPAPDLDEAARLLSNPAVQDGLSAALAQLADAFLQTRVGPMAAFTNPRDGVRPDDTLGDVMRRDDPAFDARLREGSRRTLRQAGAALGGAAAMNRELQATAARLQRVLDRYDRGGRGD